MRLSGRLEEVQPLRSAAGSDGPGELQATRIESRSGVELHLCARPPAGIRSAAVQARAMYERLLRELREHGATTRDIVTEKVFLRDVGAQRRGIREARRRFYACGGRVAPTGPACTLVQQPPARPGQLCEVQALALLPAGSARLSARGIEGLPPEGSGVVVEGEGARHVLLAGLSGGAPGDELGFTAQALGMFRRAEACLAREALSFGDVVRTWIYVADIGRDYAALNQARREFFTARGVSPPPASTGIGGVLALPDRGCGLDLRAIGWRGRREARPIQAGTMNEAPSYGSDFSRGMRVDLEDRCVVYLSGTASIDAEGRVVHPGDIEGQVERMLLNVEHLLAGQGAGYLDLVSATTYLKRPEYLPEFLRVAARRGLPVQIPNTICVADVCRPDWLCEIEATAVVL